MARNEVINPGEGIYYKKEYTERWPNGHWVQIDENNYNVEKALEDEANPTGIPLFDYPYQMGVGAVKSMADLGSGLKQLSAPINPWVDAGEESYRRHWRNKRYQEGPAGYMDAAPVGEFIPDIASAFIPGKWPVQLGIGMMEGAARMPDNPTIGATFGAAGTGGGYYAGKMANRIGTNISTRGERLRRSEYERGVIRKGEEAGLEFTPGQRSGSQADLRLESRMRKDPAFAELDELRYQQNMEALNDEAARTIGVTPEGGRITPPMRAEAVDSVGKAFDDVALATDGAALDAEHIILMEENLTLAGEQLWRKFGRTYESIAQGNHMSGADFNSARNWLANQSRKNPDIGDDIQEMMALFDDTLEAANPAQAQAIGEARKKWKALLIIENSLGGAQNAAGGNISPYGAFSALKRYEKGGFFRGRTTDNKFFDQVNAMSLAGDVQPGHTVSAPHTPIARRVLDEVFNKPLMKNYLQGGGAGRTLMGLTHDVPTSPRAGQAGVASIRGLLYNMMGLGEEEAEIMPDAP
jgi:hypothetical protein